MNSQKLLNINLLIKYLLITYVKSFLIKKIAILKASFEMLSDFKALLFDNL